MPKQKVTKMGSRKLNFPNSDGVYILGHSVGLDLCSAHFAEPSVMGRMQNTRRE